MSVRPSEFYVGAVLVVTSGYVRLDMYTLSYGLDEWFADPTGSGRGCAWPSSVPYGALISTGGGGGGGKIRTAPHGPMMWAPWVDVWFLLKTAREQPVRARECDVTEALPTHQTILLRRLTYPTKVSTECPKQEISFPVSINLGLCCSVSAMSRSMLKGTVPTTMSPRSMRLSWAGAGLPSS